MKPITPSQTIGPFSAYALTPNEKGKGYAWRQLIGNDLVTPDTVGERIRIEGRVFDSGGGAVIDALIEIWQADGQGRYAHPRDTRSRPNTSFKGFGRVENDASGDFAFDTVKPGRVPGPNGAMQAPHIVVALHMRGLLVHVVTRIYFSDEDNASDPILALVPEERRATLIARRDTSAPAATYRFDIHLQGDSETVFFDV